MTSVRAEAKNFTHYKVLQFLKQHPALSRRVMTQRLDISNDGMNYCLTALMDKGLIKLGNFVCSKQKLGYSNRLTPRGIPQEKAMVSRFLEQKMAEFEALSEEIASLKSDAQSTTIAKAFGQSI